MLNGPIYAQDEPSENTAPESATVADCVSEVCDTPERESLPTQNRQELAEEVAENMQDAMSLKRLLLGRSYVFFGRIEPEYATYFDGILKDEDGFQLRRVRVGMVGVLTDKLSYKGAFDLTDGTFDFSDFYLKWDTSRLGSLTVGNQRVSQNLSAMTGALSLLFMEHPLPVTTFSLARRLAVSQDLYFQKFGFHGMVFGKDPNNDVGNRGIAVRGFWNPVRSEVDVAHIGFSFVREKMDRDARYRTRPESNVTDIRLVDTGTFPDVDNQSTLGVEFAGARGPYTLRLEGFASRWDRADGKNADFYGAYFELGHFLTGQEFRYEKGRFMRPRIENGTRAWEVGFRASWVDLNDNDIRGGEQWNAGLALNYYHRQNIRAMLNLLRYNADRDIGDQKGWILQTRVQLNW